MSNLPAPLFELTALDKAGGTWDKLRTHLLAQLDKCRIANDALADERVTAFNRGRIAAYKELLALDKDRPVIE